MKIVKTRNNKVVRKVQGHNPKKINNKDCRAGVLSPIPTYPYTTGTLPASTASLTCYRFSSPYGNGATGTIANNGTLYYGDLIYWGITSNSGYNVAVTHDSSNPFFVYKAVIGVIDAGIIAAPVSFTYSTGTLPTGIASLTCYRDSSNVSGASTGVLSNGATIYHGDTLHFSATAETPYNTPTLSYTSTGSYTVTGNVNGVNVTAVHTTVKTFSYTEGSLPTGVSYLHCYRTSSPYQGADNGPVFAGIALYYGDTIYWEAAASEDAYNVSVTHGPNNQVTVTGNINDVSASGLSSSVKSYTYSTGTLPEGVASLSCYRTTSPYAGVPIGWINDGGTIYYGDGIQFSATAQEHYSITSINYPYVSSDKYIVRSNVYGGSISGVVATGETIYVTFIINKPANYYMSHDNCEQKYTSYSGWYTSYNFWRKPEGVSWDNWHRRTSYSTTRRGEYGKYLKLSSNDSLNDEFKIEIGLAELDTGQNSPPVTDLSSDVFNIGILTHDLTITINIIPDPDNYGSCTSQVIKVNAASMGTINMTTSNYTFNPSITNDMKDAWVSWSVNSTYLCSVDLTEPTKNGVKIIWDSFENMDVVKSEFTINYNYATSYKLGVSVS